MTDLTYTPRMGGIQRGDNRKLNDKERAKIAAARDTAMGLPPVQSESRFLRSKVWNPQPGQVLLPLEMLTEHTCHWPLGDPVAGFCGQHTAADERGRSRPYCEYHHNRSIDRRIETK